MAEAKSEHLLYPHAPQFVLGRQSNIFSVFSEESISSSDAEKLFENDAASATIKTRAQHNTIPKTIYFTLSQKLRPQNPENAIAANAADSKSIGSPRNAAGGSDISRRSLTELKTRTARVKPNPANKR